MAKTVNLSKISRDLQSLDFIFSVFTEDRANGINTVADALTRIKNVRTLNLNRVNGQLNDLADAIIRIEPDKLESVASSLASIRGAGTGRISLPRITNTIGTPVNSGSVSVGASSATTSADSITASAEEADRVVETSVARAESNLNSLSGVFKKLRSVGVSAAKTIGNGFAAVGKKVLSVAAGPFRMLQNAIQRIAAPIKNFVTMFKRRLLYRLINSIISMVTKAVKEGVNNVYQYSKAINGTLAESMDKIATSFLYFKNSLGAMLAPLLNAVAPVIDRLVDKAVDFLNIINQTIAKLTGASTWTKALKYPTEYAEAADDAAKKVKKLKNTILGLDEINLMNDNSATSVGSKKTQLDYSKMFEEVSVDINESPMMSKLERIRKTLSGLFAPIKSAWQKYGDPIMTKFHGIVEKIGTLWDRILGNLERSTVFDSILKLVESIFGFVDQILGDIIASDDESDNMRETFELIDGILSGIVGIFTTIIDKIKEALEKGDNGEKLAQSIHDLINEILGFVKDVVDKVVEFLDTTDFEPLVKAVTDVNNALKDVVKALRDDLGPIWDNIVKPILKWLLENGIPGVLQVIAGALQVIAGVLSGDMNKLWGGLETAASGVFTALKPMIVDLCKGLETVINGIIKLMNFIPGVQIEYVDMLSWYYGNPTQNISNNAPEFLTKQTYTRSQAEEFAKNFNMSVEDVMAKWNASGMTYRGFASGGMPPQGTAFIAGEAGPEIVANIGGRSGVMNVEQMSEGVAAGVRDANMEQNALLREQNSLLRVLIEKEFSATAIVSTDDIIAGLQRNNRRNGRTIVPVGV